MLDYLDTLRAKPVHVRQRIAWITTLALSLLVSGVWWSTWNTNTESAVMSVAANTKTRSPWGVVSDAFTRAKGETMAAIAQATEQLKQTTEGSVEYTPSNEEEETATSASADFAPAAPPDSPVLEDGVSGEAIHTRPKTLEQ